MVTFGKKAPPSDAPVKSNTEKTLNSGVDRRAAERRSTRTLGYLVGAQEGYEQECIVLDVSSSGAKLQFGAAIAGTAWLAEQAHDAAILRLIFRNDGQEVECRLTWSKDNQCGVTFVSPFRKAL
jgi:hypothetical protein